MKKIIFLKHALVFTIPVSAYVSFTNTGWLTFLPILFAFVILPLVELVHKPDAPNLTEIEEKIREKDPVYDWLLYLVVPAQYFVLFVFLNSINDAGLTATDKIGRIASMGLLSAVVGVNAGHELGHRHTWYEWLMAGLLNLTCLYMHFIIEHNKGHHKKVATREDPASARYGESLYRFWARTIPLSYRSAWNITMEKLRRRGKSFFSVHNEMLIFQIVQMAFVLGIGFVFGWGVLMYFIPAACIGILLVETVNYINHYGLERKETGHSYERVNYSHSWNSDRFVGRFLMFEVSRHSDHHCKTILKYQILKQTEESPLMPTGYPGMMVLALMPPLWFRIVNPKAKAVNDRKTDGKPILTS